MTKSVFSFSFFFFFFFISLLLLLAAAALATASAGNATNGLRYGGCAPGDTVGECITAADEVEEEKEGVEAVVRRILQQQRRYLSPSTQQKQPVKDCKIFGNCIGIANSNKARCTYYDKCRRYPGGRPG